MEFYFDMKVIFNSFTLFLILSLSMLSLGAAHAESLDDVSATILEFDGTSASVKLTWNHDDVVHDYDVGCVSCIPNFSEKTNQDEIVLQNITSFTNHNALLYIIAYDNNSEIITAKQIIVELR